MILKAREVEPKVSHSQQPSPTHYYRQSIRFLNGLVSHFTKGGAVSTEMITFPLAIAPSTSSPRHFHGRPHLKPRVMQVATQAIGDFILIVPLAEPRLLANRKMRQRDIRDGSVATVLTVFLLCKAMARRLILAVDALVP